MNTKRNERQSHRVCACRGRWLASPRVRWPKVLDWHRPTVSEVEAGRRRVSAEELIALAEIYGVNVAWIVGEEDEDSSLAADRVKLAARELSKLREEDLDRVLPASPRRSAPREAPPNERPANDSPAGDGGGPAYPPLRGLWA